MQNPNINRYLLIIYEKWVLKLSKYFKSLRFWILGVIQVILGKLTQLKL